MPEEIFWNICNEAGFEPERVVVERNLEIIPKDQLGQVVIQDEDVIEVVEVCRRRLRDDKDAEGNAGADLQGSSWIGHLMPDFQKRCRTKLRNAKVAVAGLGGLGSNIAVMLARSGIGKLLLVDFDVVDVTNLNRQMYLIPQLGKPKAEALPEILYQINPYLTYRIRVYKSYTG